jgi:hypothetical protein
MSPRIELRTRLIEAALDGLLPRVTGTGPKDGLAALMSTIDCTVLARRLRLRSGGGAEIVLNAANGRLLSMTGTPPAAAPDGALAVLEGEPLAPGDAETVAATLCALLDDGGLATLQADPAPGGPDAIRSGLKPADILSASGAAPAADGAAARRLPPEDAGLRAVIHMDDTGLDLGERPDEDTRRLGAWAETALEQLLSDDFPLTSSLETEGDLRLDYGTAGAVRITGRNGQLELSLLATAKAG